MPKPSMLQRVALLTWVVIIATSFELPAQQRPVRITGTVAETGTGRPVEAATVLFGSSPIALTDNAGRFEATLDVDGDEVTLTFRRIGYEARTQTFQIPDAAAQIDIDVALSRSPTVLAPIVVEGETIQIRNPGLVGFYNRRADGVGRFITEFEIDRAKSFDLTPYFQRLFRGMSRNCLVPPVVFLDGVRVDSLARVNRLIPPVLVGGIEIYTEQEVMQLPPELIPAGAYCRVILVWTREPKRPSGVTIAGQLGGQIAGATGTPSFLGGRVQFPLRAPPSTLEVQFGIDANLGDHGDRWHLSLIPTLRPFGAMSPWYLGAGVVAADETDVVLKPAVASGVLIGTGRIQPFVELKLVDVIRPNRAGFLVFSGIALRLGPRPSRNP